MNTWFIKKDYLEEFEQKVNQGNSIGTAAEEMCAEGKGISFFHFQCPKSTILLNMILSYLSNKNYFLVSVITTIET